MTAHKCFIAYSLTLSPDFFVALASHPEWGHAHTVWGDVVSEEDMAVLERLLTLPTNVVPGNPPVTNLAQPVAITLEAR